MYEPFEKFRNPKNMKSLDWYYNNSVLLTPDNWKDLKKNDILIFVYTEDEEGPANLKEIMESWLEMEYIELSVFTNFEPINKNTKTKKKVHFQKVQKMYELLPLLPFAGGIHRPWKILSRIGSWEKVDGKCPPARCHRCCLCLG